MKEQLIEFYLDYVNNFLTVARMAQYYGLTEKHCGTLIDMGKHYHEEHVNFQKTIG